MLGTAQLEGSPAEKDLGVLLGAKLNTSQQCALATKNGGLGCIKQSIEGRDHSPLLSTGEINTWSTGSSSGLPSTRHAHTGESPAKGHKDEEGTGAPLP